MGGQHIAQPFLASQDIKVVVSWFAFLMHKRRHINCVSTQQSWV